MEKKLGERSSELTYYVVDVGTVECWEGIENISEDRMV